MQFATFNLIIIKGEFRFLSLYIYKCFQFSERIWARAKWMVRRENTSGNINKVKALTEKALASIDSDYWKKAYGIFTNHFILIYLVLQEIPIIASELKSHLFTTQRQPHLQSHLVEGRVHLRLKTATTFRDVFITILFEL